MPREKDGSWLVRVGLASCGIAAGGRKVYHAFKAQLSDAGLDVKLKQTGCLGMCYNEVLVEVASPRNKSTFYGKVTPDRVPRIISEHLAQGKSVTEWAIPDGEITGLLAKQKRIVLRNCGLIDPEAIADYLAADGYQAIEKTRDQITVDKVLV